MRYLGIDYGGKRVGISMSDEEGKFAMPLIVLKNNEELVEEIIDLCRDNKVGAIVIGDSKDFNQNENEIMKEIKPFAKKIGEETGIAIHMHPEYLTSKEAEHIQGKNDMLDASAASIILQSFLDTNKNKI